MNKPRQASFAGKRKAEFASAGVVRQEPIGAIPSSSDDKKASFVDVYPEARARTKTAIEAMRMPPLSDGEIVIPVVASTEDRATDGHRIEAKGWILDEFKRNPVILCDHYRGLSEVVARAPSVFIEGNTLRADLVFPAKEIHAGAHQIGLQMLHGLLRAVSVGFTPVDFEDDPEISQVEAKQYMPMPWSMPPQLIHKAKLREISLVAIGADANALHTDHADKSAMSHRADDPASTQQPPAPMPADGGENACSTKTKVRMFSAEDKALLLEEAAGMESALTVARERFDAMKSIIDSLEPDSQEGEPVSAEGEPVPEEPPAATPDEGGRSELDTLRSKLRAVTTTLHKK